MGRNLYMLFSVLMMALLLWLFFSHKPKVVADPKPPAVESNLQSWILYKAPSGKFSVRLPAAPQIANSNVVDKETKEPMHYSSFYAQDNKGALYLISLIAFRNSDKVEEENGALNDAVQDLVKSHPKNILLESNQGQLGGNKTLDFVIENDKSHIVGKVFRSGHQLVVLTVATAEGVVDPKDFDFFVNSFEPISITK